MPITTYIEEDLAARLRAGQELPVALTLDSISQHYKVSTTPVRRAVAKLIDEGLLKKGANQRLALGDRIDRGNERAAPVLPSPPRDMYEVIRNDLIKLSFEGEPVYLREVATAKKYGLGRSAMRDIMNRLAGVGIVEHLPRRGWRLHPFRQEELQSYIEVRESLELKALHLARPHLVDEDLQRMIKANADPVSEEDFQRPPDNSLHTYIIEKSGNSYIKDFFERQGQYIRSLFDWEIRDRDTAVRTARQHREILNALLKKEWRVARKLLSDHIRNNHVVLSNIIPSERASKESDQ